MELLNADGTTPEMCGNGLRCLVKYAVEEMGLRANPLDVDTVAGLRRCSYTLDEEGVVSTVRVEMGPTIVEPSKVDEYEGWAVDVGNPHFVLLDDPAAADRRRAERVGAQLTSHERFPEGANIEFVDVIDATHLRVVVYERGCGLTQACGTGATAAVAAAVHSGRCEADSDIRVSLPGGDLSIRISASSAQSWMEGPASEVYRGTMSSAP